MEVTRRVKYAAPDSWEGEVTCRGVTYLVEATQRIRRGEQVWHVEVLKPTDRISVKPLHYSAHPTLQTALQAAERFIVDTTEKSGRNSS